MELRVGSVVISKAGRDKLYRLAVLSVLPNGDIMTADGKERPIDRPKRKNVKHVAVTGKVLTPEEMSTNKSLKAALKSEDIKIEGEIACQKKI